MSDRVRYAGVVRPRWLLAADCPDCGMAAGQPCAAISHNPEVPLSSDVRLAFTKGQRVHSGRARAVQHELDVLTLLVNAGNA